MKSLRLKICTWNVGASHTLNSKDFLRLLDMDESEPVDMIAIALQEIETGVVETAKSFISYDDWTISFISTLSKHGYYLVESVRVQGISLSVFAKIQHLPFIRFIKTDIERTGVASSWGDKGGVAISGLYYNESICFLNTHLEAHLWNNEERMNDFKEVFGEIDFNKTTTINDHTMVFWAGDLNFRIDELPRNEVIQLVKQQSYENLLKEDQLKKHLCEGGVFSEFVEGQITFPPTFKFNPGTSMYDTSEKQRKPAWTDRILYRMNKDKQSVATAIVEMPLSNLLPQKLSLNATVEQVEGSYKSHMGFRNSDHKPVTSEYIICVPKAQDPLVVLNVEGIWKNICEGSVTINYHNGMKSESRDYLALYEVPFTDHRSHRSRVNAPVNGSEKSMKKLNHVCSFPGVNVEKDRQFCIGYYSEKMSCVLALSEPFHCA